MENFTIQDKEKLAVEKAIECFNGATTNPNSNPAPIYAAIQASRFYGVYGEIAARKHFNINPNWALPIGKSMGGIYATY